MISKAYKVGDRVRLAPTKGGIPGIMTGIPWKNEQKRAQVKTAGTIIEIGPESITIEWDDKSVSTISDSRDIEK